MNFLSKFEFTPINILKFIGVCLLAVVGIAFVLSVVFSFFKALPQSFSVVAPSMPSMGGGTSYGVAFEKGYDALNSFAKGSGAELSVRNVAQTTGSTAEAFEVTDYNASIETRDLDKTCGAVKALKALSYVIFESSNEADTSCYYTFKVEHAHSDEILGKIQALDPKDLSEGTYTIKEQVDDFTAEEQVLEKKKASIDATLADALLSYDRIAALATNSQDAATLAKIIDSKIGIIERLTQEKININEQLDRLSRAKAEQLDRLEYTYFTVNVYENKYIDGTSLKDSWKAAVKDFVRTVNQAAQDATLNVLAFLFVLIPYIIYFFILLVAAKFGWKFAKYVWQR